MWKSSEESNKHIFKRNYLKPLFIDVRCPECQKLYRIDTRDIVSELPYFDCIQCHVTFTVQIDQSVQQKFVVQTLRSQTDLKLKEQRLNPEFLKICPKCRTLNLKSTKECHKCQLIFANYQLSQAEDGVLPSLVKAWNEILKDYHDFAKHLAFVHQCEELQAIPFALKKYWRYYDNQSLFS